MSFLLHRKYNLSSELIIRHFITKWQILAGTDGSRLLRNPIIAEKHKESLVHEHFIHISESREQASSEVTSLNLPMSKLRNSIQQ